MAQLEVTNFLLFSMCHWTMGLNSDKLLRFLFVQCYAWTEYKFTSVCVCVCVCVSVTLSVNSPTGQTPQRIFTVDSLKNADLRKDVPFEGLDDK